jgi:hypothetical protein
MYLESTLSADLPRCYRGLVKRLVMSLAIGYSILALVGRAQEAAGMRTCGCSPDRWCRKPGLSLFRWVFPRAHRDPEFEAWKKRHLGESS